MDVQDITVYQGKWLTMRERHVVSPDGREKVWEYATRGQQAHTVAILAIRREPPPACLILVRQPRPAIGAHTLEFPAGLVDAGESAEAAGLRELAEETGYLGIVTGVSPYVYNSPGLTDENVSCVTIEITGRQAAHLDPDECIEVIEAPLAGLLDTLRAHEEGGTRIVAKLWWYALALSTQR